MKYQWLLILVLISGNIGCAKLGQTTMTQDLLGEQSTWSDDSLETPDEQIEEEESEQDQGKTVDFADQEATDISVMMTAKPKKKSSDEPVAVNPINCGHSLECDCQSFQKPPKLPYAQPVNPPIMPMPPLAAGNYSLTPLSKDNLVGQTSPTRGKSINHLRPQRTTEATAPLVLEPQTRLQPLAPKTKTLSPSISPPIETGLQALPQQTPKKNVASPYNDTDLLSSLVKQPCEHCDQNSCRGNCLNLDGPEDQEWDKLFAWNPTPSGDCPDCEAGLCETKDMIIAPENSIAINEPPLAIPSPSVLAEADSELDAMFPVPHSETPTLLNIVAPNRVATVPATLNRQVNGFERKNQRNVEHAFVPPTTINRESPLSESAESPSNELMPRTEKSDNPTSLPTPSSERNQLDSSIQKLKDQIEIETSLNRRNALEVNLKLLEFLRHQLVNDGTLISLSPDEKESWEHQLEAMETMTHGGGEEATGEATDATLDSLRKAMARLESIAELQVTNGAICSEIKGFGKYRPFSENTFQAGQPILVYCEIANYESKEQEVDSEKLVQSKFKGSYKIENVDGKLVQTGDYPIIEDNAPKRRSDFYLYFKIELKQLEAGNYRLRLEIEDLIGQKKGHLEENLLFIVQ
jgi:hypothetical protein